MKKTQEILKNCPLFYGVEESEIEKVLSDLGQNKCFAKKGEVIFCEGERALYIGIVISGVVRVIREDYYGNRSILAHIGEGGIFGESFACAGVSALPVSVIAEEECSYLLINCKKLISEPQKSSFGHDRIIFNLLKLVAEKNLVLNQKLEITSKRTTREKLMAYLMNQAKLQGKEEFLIPYDRQALADYLEVDRSGLSSEIGRLKREGKIECQKNCFRLLKG